MLLHRAVNGAVSRSDSALQPIQLPSPWSWSGDRPPGRAELVLLLRGQHYAPVSVCTTHGDLQLPLYPRAAGA